MSSDPKRESDYLELWRSTIFCNMSITRLLIENGVDVNAVDSKGNTKLMNVIYCNEGDVELIKYLLSIPGIDVNKVNKEYCTPLHSANQLETVRLLVEAGANINAITARGNSPIMINKSDDAIRYLVEKGADLTIKNKEGNTVFDKIKNHALLKSQFIVTNENFEKMKDEEKVSFIEKSSVILSKEQKSELIQKILASF